MVRFFTFSIIIFIFSLLSSNVLSQDRFVTFQTTNQNKLEVCQGKTFGIIAKLAAQYEGYTTFQWKSDSTSLAEAHGELAVVNISTPGEKKIIFSLNLGKNNTLDTVLIVTVLPNPEVIIDYKDETISFFSKNDAEISSYRWVHNNTVLPEGTKKSIVKPESGEYRVVITDSKGCKATSASITVE